MNINTGIIDQRLRGVVEEYAAFLPQGKDEAKRKSAAFVLLCMSAVLNIELNESADYLTEGGGDFGIDGMHIGDVQDGEFIVTLFQGKYKSKLEGSSNFPENAIIKLIHSIGALFDPYKKIQTNDNLRPRYEEARSLVSDGYMPIVHAVCCNNGIKWKNEAQDHIDNSGFGDQVRWSHVNHDYLVQYMQSTKSIDDRIHLTGEVLVEDFDFRRVLIGKVPVMEIKALFERHGDKLLERNIRRHLGTHRNRVNEGIRATLIDEAKRPNFYFFNNGITMICSKFGHNALQKGNHLVQIENMQVINGGQTCHTIRETLSEPGFLNGEENMRDASVMLRLYQLDEGEKNLVHEITYATNSQNPVDLRDLRSNDQKQISIETALREQGFEYRRHRGGATSGTRTVHSSVAAEAVCAIWREKPHQAKFRRAEHFGKLYDVIFDETLNGAQLLMAVFIFRVVENERKRPKLQNPPDFLPYASHFIAMLMGRYLLRESNISLSGLDHRNLDSISNILTENKDTFYNEAIENVKRYLSILKGSQDYTLQRLAATFRRGDLLRLAKKNPKEIQRLLEESSPI